MTIYPCPTYFTWWVWCQTREFKSVHLLCIQSSPFLSQIQAHVKWPWSGPWPPCFIDRILLTGCLPCSPTYFSICWLNIRSGRIPHGRIYSQRRALQYPPIVTVLCTGFPVTVTSKSEFVQWIDNLEGCHSLRVYPAMWHPSRLYIEPTDCKQCWGTWWATSEQDPINETWWSRSRLGLFDMGLNLGYGQRWLDALQVNRFEFASLVPDSPGEIFRLPMPSLPFQHVGIWLYTVPFH